LLTKNKNVFYVYLFFGIWFCLGLIPHLQLVPLDKTFATRWFYFSFVGLIGMLAAVLSSFKININQGRKIFLIFAIAIVYGIFAFTTIIRNTEWYNGVTLFEHETVKQKNVYELEYNYGFALMQEQEYDKAIKHFEKTMELVPNNTVALGNLCFSYLHASRLNDARKCYEHLLTLDKNATANYGPLILVYLLQDDAQDAKELAYKGLNQSPSDGLLWRALGLAAYKLNDIQLAQTAFEKSYELVPNDVAYYYLNQIKNKQQIQMREL
jgi:tetratricopeptide (TPR) repeat protein